MGRTIAEKIIEAHLLEGTLEKGAEIAIKIDQTLTQDATGTMAYLEFEKMGVGRVRTEKSVAYVDHNTLGCGFENADDHNFIRTCAEKFGVWYSCPGNGICHQVHLERFGAPGKTLLGSDSHTPTCGGLGMLAIGAGGLDVAVAMGGGAYRLTMPGIIKVELTGKLKPFVSAKDAALEILRRLSVKGGVGYILEWGGEGVKTLSVPERATIANMGAELGATTTVFPSDEITRAFLRAEGREGDFVALSPDGDARYDRVERLDLSALEPLCACPHRPDNVVKVSELSDVKVDQVCIGSCTNSSLADLYKVAALLKGKTVARGVSLSVSPGSKQVLSMLAEAGGLNDILASGARLLECACGPCIGMGFSPPGGGVSLRTFNRNFEGRSGTADGKVYLVSPETAAASALTGYITDPRSLGEMPRIDLPEKMKIDDSAVYPPASPENADKVQILRGANIGELPEGRAIEDAIVLPVSLKVGDHITTDHIMPAGAKILPFRSNIPYLSRFCFGVCDKDFPERAKALGQSLIVGGENYGQGSSREHAALVPCYLGVRMVIAKSFARIHRANLINAGILPLTFANEEDCDALCEGDTLSFSGLHEGLEKGTVSATTAAGKKIELRCELTDRQKKILRAGGLLKFTAAESEGK